MFTIGGILYLVAVSSALDERIHKRMTLQQIAEVFHKSHHDLVPNYDVVQIRVPHREKRDVSSPQKLIVEAFGRNIEAYVYADYGELATENTPVYEAFYHPTYGPNFRRLPNAMRRIGELWANPETKTSLIVKRDTNGQYLMNGYIASNNLIVRSLPDSILEDLRIKNPGNNSKLLEHSAYHVVYKGDSDHLARLAQTDLFANQDKPNGIADTVIFPEIMVVVDNECFEKHGRNIDKMLAYLLAFWNGVDMAYRNFRYPAIRLRISQVIIGTSSAALPFIHNNMDKEFVNANRAWEAAEYYFFQKLRTFPSDTFDAIIILTGHDLTINGTQIDAWGVATMGGMCRIYYNSQRVDSVGLSSEDGAFTHVFTVAHELGHLFNMSHDGEKQNACIGNAGYIMSPSPAYTRYSHSFSSCSVKEIDRFFNMKKLLCTFTTPSNALPMPRILPGDLLSRNEQCRKKNYTSSCYQPGYGFNACLKIYCEKNNQCLEESVFPPEGAFCGAGKICIHGICEDRPRKRTY